MRSEQEAQLAIEKYSDMIRKVCFMHLKNYHDTEDIFQEVFLKYVLHEVAFQSDKHEKAWLLRVAINACKDKLKSFFRKKISSFEELTVEPSYEDEDNREIIDAVLALPPNFKNVIYLFYYEGYSAKEIAVILHKNENTVYTWLSRARTQLKSDLGGELFE